LAGEITRGMFLELRMLRAATETHDAERLDFDDRSGAHAERIVRRSTGLVASKPFALEYELCGDASFRSAFSAGRSLFPSSHHQRAPARAEGDPATYWSA
jgi:hypothetical protein